MQRKPLLTLQQVWFAVQKIPPVTEAEVKEEIPTGDHDAKRWLIRSISYPTVLFGLGYMIISGDSSFTLMFWGLIVVLLACATASVSLFH
jgi:hypothetical protein